VWLAPLDGAPPRRLTHDAEPGVSNGLAEYVAAEELDRFEGLWWSSDSSRIAYARVDERPVPPYVIASLGAEAPGHETHHYPFVGGPNARVSLHVLAVDGGPSVAVELGMAADDYLARVVAHPHGGWLAAVLPRDQRSLHWLRVLPDGGAGDLWTETASPWLNLDHDTRVLADGRVLRSTERSGFRHLELRNADGSPAARLTDGGWVVTEVVHVDEARAEVLFIATRDGVTERHLYAVPLDPGELVRDPVRLSAEPGWHQAVVSRDGLRWADTWSTLELAPAVAVRGRDHSAAVTVHQPTVTATSIGLAPPELLELTAADGATTLHAALYRPTRTDAGPPRCVVWVYGGPHSQYVKRAWELTAHALRQYLVQAGAAVLVVDNRGTAHRGIAFEAILERHLGAAEVADQAAAVRQLAAVGELDPSRVGMMGGSYGGFMTLMAMATEPQLFGVGVAISPVVEWAGYDTAYTERYLGTPAEHAPAYLESSPRGRASAITGDLLLIHGALDENVHLRHSVRMVAAFQAAGREVELVLLPDQRHRVRGDAALGTRERRTLAHLLTGLGLPLPSDLISAAATAAADGNPDAAIGVEVAQAAPSD
jgi:dipeptidyl-peptidase-4